MKLVPTTRRALPILAMLTLSCSGSDDAARTTQSVENASDTAGSTDNQATPAAANDTSAGSHAQAGASAQTGEPTTSLALPALEPGFQRFVAPSIEVPSGVSDDWIHWVGGPTDQDYDVVAVKGAQSKGGHHALMLSIRDSNPVGFTRMYTERDQLTSSSLGGIGAEGSTPVPEGVVYRVKKGTYFAIQTHYLNPTDAPLLGETYVDIKLTPTNPEHTVATHFASTSLAISLDPHAQSSMDITCEVGQDLQVLRMTNHMHHYGVSVFTELTDPAGVTTMLKHDETWSEDWALTPNYENFPVDDPFLITKGSTLRTHCIWNNDSDKAVTFPTEMCVFATVILGENDISCVDGQFRVSETDTHSEQPNPAAMSGAPTVEPSGDGACTGSEDTATLGAMDFVEAQRTCGAMCIGDTEMCTTACLTKNTTLSADCASCNGQFITCAMTHCLADCSGGFMSPSCMPCAEAQCGQDYHSCSGL